MRMIGKLEDRDDKNIKALGIQHKLRRRPPKLIMKNSVTAITSAETILQWDRLRKGSHTVLHRGTRDISRHYEGHNSPDLM